MRWRRTAAMGEPRRFGGALRLREQAADVWGWAWLDDFWLDLRYAARQVRRTPWFVLVAVLTLAIGIGANTTTFGLLKTIMFAQPPVPEPAALRQFEWASSRNFSESSFRYVRDHGSGFAALTCISVPDTVLLGRGDRQGQAHVVLVAGDFFRTFGVTPARGRSFVPDDERPGAPPVAVLSHEAWQGRFGADPSIVGTLVLVVDAPVTVVGVLRPGFATVVDDRPRDLLRPLGGASRPDAKTGAPEPSCKTVGRLDLARSEEQTRQASELLFRQSGPALPVDQHPPPSAPGCR